VIEAMGVRPFWVDERGNGVGSVKKERAFRPLKIDGDGLPGAGVGKKKKR